MKRIIYILLLLCVAASNAQSQKLQTGSRNQKASISRSYQNRSLSSVLEDLNAFTGTYDISFVYNDLEDFTVTTSFKGLGLEDALRQVVGLYPVRITKEGEKYFVECIHKTELHLTGRVTDEHGQPVPFANIAVLNPADSTILSGGVSNEDGRFVVPYEQQKILARITYIGYKTVYRLCTQEDMGTVQLQPEAYTLGGVTVKGLRPQFKQTMGGMEVNVDGTLLANMGTAMNVIGELPLVVVKDGKIDVLAKGEPEVYINSKKVRDMSELNELKSTDIKSIQVITNPGARYDATVDAVIRIKTIRRLNEGLSFRSSTMVSYNSKWMGEQEAQLTYRQGGLETFAHLSYADYCQKEKDELAYSITNGQENVMVQQVGNLFGRTRFATGKAGFSYDLNSQHSVGLTYQLNKMFNPPFSMDGMQTIWQNGQKKGSIDNDWTIKPSNGLTHSVDAYYAGTAGQLSINFDGTCFWDKDGQTQDVTEIGTDVESRKVKTESNNRKRLLAGKIVVGYPIAGGQLEIGTEVSHTKIHSLYYSNFEQIPSADNSVRESHLSFFSEYSRPLGKSFLFGVGLRYEHVANDYESFDRHVDEVSRKYDQLFPNVSLAWKQQKWAVELNYNQRVKRPSYHALTRHLQYDSRYLYEGGNMFLQPQFNHNISLNAVYSWLNIHAEYCYQDNRIMQLATLFNGQPIQYTKWENVSRLQYLFASLTAAPKFGCYQPQYTLTVYKQLFDAASYGISHNLEKPRVWARMQNRFTLGKTSFVSLDLTGFTRYSSNVTEYKATAFANLNFYKAFCAGRLTLNVSINDLFYSNRERWTEFGEGNECVKEAWANSRSIMATLTYSFNQKRSKYRGTGAGEDEKSRF